MSAPGRFCPAHYYYGAASIARQPEQHAQVLYVIGGLYGNQQALAEVITMAAAETLPVSLVFNGDFNWFNVDDAGFSAINDIVLSHDALLGNVEAALLDSNDQADCGCAYPAYVANEVVERSNQIHSRLKQTLVRNPHYVDRLEVLPMVRRYRVGDCRVGVVHGDSESLAGWRFDVRSLREQQNEAWLLQQLNLAQVDIFASTHTCLPVVKSVSMGKKWGWFINNGSAGMPNFRQTTYGVITRIGIKPSPHQPLYRYQVNQIWLEVLAVRFDQLLWITSFQANWPKGSAADLSYFSRIVNGPEYEIRDALLIE